MCLKVLIFKFTMGYLTANHSLSLGKIFLGSQIVISRLLGEHGFWAREASCLMHPSPCGAIPADAVFMEQCSLYLWMMLEVLCHSLFHISFWLALSVDMSVLSALSHWTGLGSICLCLINCFCSDPLFLTDVLFPLPGGDFSVLLYFPA